MTETRSIINGWHALKSLNSIITAGSYSSITALVDKRVYALWNSVLRKHLPRQTNYLSYSLGERHKNLKTLSYILSRLQHFGCDRKALLINIGGGTTTDLGGFAASIYLRGIDFINVPTTLLAQVDAALGGKTGINFGGAKNLVGQFVFPVITINDHRFLNTLPQRHLRNGLAEMLKHGALFDSSHFKRVLNFALKPSDGPIIAREIKRSCELKTTITVSDPFEKGERRLLNFGHTFGHALEALSLKTPKPLLHGEAIAIGMSGEVALAEILGIAEPGTRYALDHALEAAKLPNRLPKRLKVNRTRIIEKLFQDKKTVKRSLTFSLISEIGRGIIVEKVPLKAVHRALSMI